MVFRYLIVFIILVSTTLGADSLLKSKKHLKWLESGSKYGEIVPYRDGDGYSAGWGHTLIKGEKSKYLKLSKKQRRVQNIIWFERDWVKHETRIRRLIPSYGLLSPKLRNQLLYATYRGSLSGSPKTLALINKGKYKKAAIVFLDNNEYKKAKKKKSGVYRRMKAVSNALSNEHYRTKYVMRYNIIALPKDLQEIVLYSVVTSGKHGVRVMQRLLGVIPDGVVGPVTTRAMYRAKFSKKEFKDAILTRYKKFRSWKRYGKKLTRRFEQLAKE